METWLTYLAAMLMAAATAFTFSSSPALASATAALTQYVISFATVIFLLVAAFTFISGTASLKKDKLGGKALRTTILWSLVTTGVLTLVAAYLAFLFPQKYPVSSSAGMELQEALTTFTKSSDPMGLVGLVSKALIPTLVIGWFLGSALTPSSDVIRPAYTVMNSFSEAMFRIQRTAAYFGAVFVYCAGTAFFLNLWQEKTIIVAPEPFKALCLATLLVILVVLPLLYGLFTGFKRNPYGIIGRSIASLVMGFVTSNVYASSLVGESISRCNLGSQKTFVSTATPIGILITRGGTAFVSAAVSITLLQGLGAELDAFSILILAGFIACASFISFLNAGTEVLAVTYLAVQLLELNLHGSEASIIALLPILNGIGTMLDTLLINMASSISSVRTKTDARIPLQETI